MFPELQAAEKLLGIELRDYQRNAVLDIIKGRDTLVRFPTGSGKSAVFLTAAYSLPGLTLVVSPLIALMQDQCRKLKTLPDGSGADYLSRARSRAENTAVLENLDRIKVLYITPERLVLRSFKEYLRKKDITVSQVAVDEAHAVSFWGRGFRPSYLGVGKFLAAYPGAVRSAYTATAGGKVLQDITDLLRLRNPVLHTRPVLRENLDIRACFTDKPLRKLLEVLNGGEVSLVYIENRLMAEKTAYMLRKNGFQAEFYHAGMPPDERASVQESFITGRTRTVVATSAFGMGVDKADVRHVVHIGMPRRLEDFLQEAGRGGRDGNSSRMTLITGRHDRSRSGLFSGVMEYIFKPRFPENCSNGNSDTNSLWTSIAALFRLIQERAVMERFIWGGVCRRDFIRTYFGDERKHCAECTYTVYSPELSPHELIIMDVLRAHGGLIDQERLKRLLFGLSEEYLFCPGYALFRGKQLDLDACIYNLLESGLVSSDGKGRIRVIKKRRCMAA